MPSYRISPFTTKDIALNTSLPDDNSIDDYFNERFGRREFYYTYNGRQALNCALSYYNLQKDDIVTILTTTNNFYISSCVTTEISKFCHWSRAIESNTKVILVNHEFGYPYQHLEELNKTGIPIIEDCAHSFFSVDSKRSTGTIGDFVIYSFPKMFPIQIGGLLLSNIMDRRIEVEVDHDSRKYIQKVLSHHIRKREQIKGKRHRNYNTLNYKFKALGFNERFQPDNEIVPGVFMFTGFPGNFKLPKLKEYYYANGVQCSIFYGEDSFFLPVHQALKEADLEYFVEIFKSFLKKTAI